MLSWKEAVEEFENLVKYATKYVSGILNDEHMFDTCVDEQDLYQEGFYLLYACWKQYKSREIGEFRAIFQTALFRRLWKVGTKAKGINCINIDLQKDAEDYSSVVYSDEEFEQIFIEYGIRQLRQLLEDDYIATLIFQELLEPSKRTMWEMKMDNARKEALRQQGIKVNSSGTKIKMVHICRALEITQKQFDDGLFRLRQSANQVFSVA
jgi:hypothetical protein